MFLKFTIKFLLHQFFWIDDQRVIRCIVCIQKAVDCFVGCGCGCGCDQDPSLPYCYCGCNCGNNSYNLFLHSHCNYG